MTTAVANGDLTQKITADVKGEILEIKDVINRMVDQLNSFSTEVTRVAKEVGTEGKLGGQADVRRLRHVEGPHRQRERPRREPDGAGPQHRRRSRPPSRTAIFSRRSRSTPRGEILELKNTINVMVDQLSSFAAEVTRVAREVGTEGKLGGQAKVPGVAAHGRT